MAMNRGNQPSAQMQQMMMDQAVDMSLEMTAKMFGLPKETVTTIVQAGLPMMAQMAESNPELLKTMYGQSMKLMPEPIQAFYSKLADNPQAQQALVDEFQTMYGPMTEALQREAASQAGVSHDQAGQVLATTHPALAQAMGQANTGGTEQGFAQRLKDLRG
jgi:hypothetical protein